MCSAISSSSTSSRTAFTPWRTRASTSSFTSCSNSCFFEVKCLPSHSTHNLPDTICRRQVETNKRLSLSPPEGLWYIFDDEYKTLQTIRDDKALVDVLYP